MADTITITEQDRIDAEALMEQFLGDRVDGDFSKGSMLRDLVISGLANIFAYFMNEVDTVKARQSLLLLGKLTGVSADDAVDEILSNWFLTRKTGRYATGVVTVYLTERADIAIPITAKFYKTGELAFVPNYTDTFTVSGNDLLQVVDSDGTVVAYTTNVSLKAYLPGDEYNIEPGSFTDFTRFNPYVTRVENVAEFSGGGGAETTAELLDRAPTAISVRDLNSSRSIDATLKDEFTDVQDVTVIGMGDAEMIRDLILEETTPTRIHAGGCVDAYLRSPLETGVEFTGEVGGVFTDPRPGYYILRDDKYSDFTTETSLEAGHVIVISNALTLSEAQMYIIKDVTPYGLYVSRRAQFPLELPTVVATYSDGELIYDGGAAENRVSSAGEYTFTSDDVGKFIRVLPGGIAGNVGTGEIDSVNDVPNYAVVTGFDANFTTETGVEFALESRVVQYTAGKNSPTFNDEISYLGTGNPVNTGMFTKNIQNNGRVVLPFVPIYRITDVSVDGTGLPPTWLASDGRMHFDIRVNREPIRPVSPAAGNFEYQVVCRNPEEGSSGWQIYELDIAWPTVEGKSYFNGKTVKVVYDTITGYTSVWDMMVSSDRRIECGSVIPKGLHAVYLAMNIRYQLTRTATTDIDTTEAAAAVADYINNFDTREDIDTSDIIGFLRSTYANIGRIEPFNITYTLYAPDGRAIGYETSDNVSIDPTYQTGAVAEDLLDDPLGIGVSDNTLRYLTTADLITFTKV